jgi:hypothetical protein
MPRAEDDEEKPLDPNVEKVRRKLVRFMGINLGLLFLALMVVVGALVYKARKPAPSSPPAAEIPVPPGEPISGDIVLPVGSRIVSHSISGNRIAIDAELAEGGRAIFVYDMAERRMVGRFALRTE